MASIPWNVQNDLVLSEPRQSSVEWIAEMTELHSHDFSCFCFFGVLDIWELTSWRNPKSYLTQWWLIAGRLWHLWPVWFPLYLLRGSRPSQTTCVFRDHPSSFPIALPLSTCSTWGPSPKQERSSVRPCVCHLCGAGRLTHTAQPKPDFGTGSSHWQRHKQPWNPNPKSQHLK